MTFDFFTFGGGWFWEDVFFYQKWRIQRHASSKKYRLLDPWDIRRHKGSFEDCRRAFVKFIELYEIPRQKGHMVVMLHGLGDSKNIFKPLWRRLISEGLLAAAVNYPSTRKDVFSHAKQIDFLINNMEDIKDISFVTVGAGGIVLRKLLSFNSSWQQRMNIRKIVQISPPNSGYKVFELLSNMFLGWFFGPMAKELTPQHISKIPLFKKDLTVGVIYANYPFYNVLRHFPPAIRKILPNAKDAELPGITEKIQVKNRHDNPLKNRKIVAAVVNFLKKGKFAGN